MSMTASVWKQLYPGEKRLRPLWWMMVFSPLATGLFYEWMSGLAVIFLIAYLFFLSKSGGLKLPMSLSLLAASALPLCYGLTAFWAVDRGEALLGFVKFLPLPLFALAAAQFSPEQRQDLLRQVPFCGALVTIVTFFLSMIPSIGGYFTVAGRLCGTFQYPNTFALFLLTGVIAAVAGKKASVARLLCTAVLIFGIFQSGSRTAFILLAITLAALIFLVPDKRVKIILAGFFGTGVLLSLGYVWLTGNFVTVGRYLTGFWESSTFLGRILYFKDSLPVIVSHPFGLGYNGYHYLQGSFQTGVYSLAFIHNDFLQILLDVGWLPCLLLLSALAYSLFSKSTGAAQKLMLLGICAHSLFDFNLQFIYIFFLLILTMKLDCEKGGMLCLPRSASAMAALLLCGTALYFTTASLLFFFHNYSGAVSLYPAYTSAWQALLPQASTAEEMDDIADRILAVNKSVSLAWSAKARAAFSAGDFTTVIAAKEKAISLSRYELTEYLDYFYMLQEAEKLYTGAGDEGSARICREKLRSIPAMLDSVKKGSDPLAWEIDEKPSLELPREYRDILEKLP